MAAAAGGVMLTLLLLRPLTLMGLDDAWRATSGWPCRSRVWWRCRCDSHQCAAGERSGDYRLYRVVAPLLAKMLGARRLLPRLMLRR